MSLGWVLAQVRSIWPLVAPISLVVLIAMLGVLFASDVVERVIILGLISVGLTVGLYTFTGNSGILSFGHLSFMTIGAYVSAFFTVPIALKSLYYVFPGPLAFLATAEQSPLVAIIIGMATATVVAAVVGPILARLSGIEASIGTLALLLVFNVVVSGWDSVTQGQRTVVGVPDVVQIPQALIYTSAAITVAFAYQRSRPGRRLRASREDADAARVLGVNIARERWLAFVLSAAIVGAGGGLFAHFSQGFNPNDFYLERTFLIVAMLIIGGRHSLAGAVIGAVAVSALAELLRELEAGINVLGYAMKVRTGVGDVVLGLVLLLVLILRPEGIVAGREIEWPFKRTRRDGPNAPAGSRSEGSQKVSAGVGGTSQTRTLEASGEVLDDVQ